jgi:hypothetical protein
LRAAEVCRRRGWRNVGVGAYGLFYVSEMPWGTAAIKKDLPLMIVLDTSPEEELNETPPDHLGGMSERGPDAPCPCPCP